MTRSRVIHVQISIPKQYEMMMSSQARVKFIKSKVIFRYHTKSVSSFIKVGSLNQKLFMFNFHYKKGKNKKVGKNFWVIKRGNKEIANQGRFQELQIGARRTTNRGRFRDFKLGQGFQIWAKRFQIGADVIIRGKRDFKSMQGLQIGAGATNRSRTNHL